MFREGTVKGELNERNKERRTSSKEMDQLDTANIAEGSKLPQACFPCRYDIIINCSNQFHSIHLRYKRILSSKKISRIYFPVAYISRYHFPPNMVHILGGRPIGFPIRSNIRRKQT